MPYVKTRTVDDVDRDIQNNARQLIQAIKGGIELQAEMLVLAAELGPSASLIATALGTTTDFVADANKALSAFIAINDFAEGNVVAQGNYLDDLRRFT